MGVVRAKGSALDEIAFCRNDIPESKFSRAPADGAPREWRAMKPLVPNHVQGASLAPLRGTEPGS